MHKNAQQEFMQPPCASRPFCEIAIMQIVRIPEESIFRVPLTAMGQNKHQGWDTILGMTEFIFMPLHKDQFFLYCLTRAVIRKSQNLYEPHEEIN